MSGRVAGVLGLNTLFVMIMTGAAPADTAHAPNIQLYVSQRIFPLEPSAGASGKRAAVSVSMFNVRRASISLHPVDIADLVPNASAIDAPDDRRNPKSVRARLAGLKLRGAVRTIPVVAKRFYRDAWLDQTVVLPRLSAGVYVVRAFGGGVDVRTWLAVSRRALVVKRTPDDVQAWLVNLTTGQPAAGATLALYDAKGRVAVRSTGKDGLVAFPRTPATGPLWVAARGGDPAFARAPAPEEERPYLVYVTTDRPVYRPGNLVRFRGTVRAVRRGVYSLPKETMIRVQIKTRGDTMLYDEKLPLNDWGTFAGEFQLATEPPLGTYSLEVVLPRFRDYASFEVEAYRKPEFDVEVGLPAAHRLGGEPIPVTISAQYYFGSPVAGGRVKYSVHFEQESEAAPPEIRTAAGLGSAAVGSIEEDFTGQGVLDANGKLEVTVPTRSVPFDRRMSVRAEVTELALRPRAATADMLITSAQFCLTADPEQPEYRPGDSAKMIVTARDYDDKPVAVPVRVILIEYLTDREGRTYAKRTERAVTTDKEGRGAVTFKLPRPGEYDLQVWARDAEGNAVFAGCEIEVTVEKIRQWPTLAVALEKDRYVPGDTAVIAGRTSLLGGWVWLTVEGEHIYRSEVRRLLANEFRIKLPVTAAWQPGVRVRLSVVRRGELVSARADLAVPAADKALNVIVSPDKEVYQPGETATLDLTVRDHDGRGVATETGIGVVDAALYAILPDISPNPFDVFWAPQTNRVATGFSSASAYPGGGYQRMTAVGMPPPSPPSPGAVFGVVARDEEKGRQTPRIRRLFVDTAFWAPSVLTAADGHGVVRFTVPDNLTTWRTTARSISRETAAGETRKDVKVTLPLLVRLTLPRFYVANDSATAAAIIHNYTSGERTVHVMLTAEGAEIEGAAERTITLPADGIQRITWSVHVAGVPADEAADHVRFLVSADGGGGAKDAMESTLPVYPDGVKRVDGYAGMSADTVVTTIPLPAEAITGKSSLDVTLSPSLAGPLFEALDYLVAYPHGCAEQTMDRFLPSIIAARALHESGALRPEPPLLQRYVSFGLQKLLRYQHQDGGWHWWEFDESDPYMTAYVVYGLAMARDAGYPLAAGPLPRGVDYLRRVLAHEEDRTAACYMLWSLAYANRWDAKSFAAATRVAQRLIVEQGRLDAFSRASLALALDRLSRQLKAPAAFATQARALATQLESEALVTGTAAHWTANAHGDGSWLDSDVEVTAHVLDALLALKSDSAQIVPAVRWLMAARRGRQWNSTKDTAAAVLALTTYLQRAEELTPDETVTVRVGDHIVQTIHLGKEQVFADPVRVTVPSADLKPGANVLRLEKSGGGNLYWSAQLHYVIPADHAVPLDRGIELKRRYRVAAADPVTAGEQPPGSIVEVTTDIIASQNYRYCLLEEPIPAGCEVITGDQDRDESVGCERREVWDDRLVFYFDYLPKGVRTVTYYLRTEAPGLYRIRPETAALMYFPEVRGEGRLVRLKVTE